MKDYTKEVTPINVLIDTKNSANINSDIFKAFIETEICQKVIKEGSVIFDTFFKKHEYYNLLKDKNGIAFILQDKNIPLEMKSTAGIKTIETENINELKSIKDKSVNVIFADGSKIGYGKYLRSIEEFERVIVSEGYCICDLSRYWYNSRFNQLIFGSRGWNIVDVIEVSYLYKDEKESKEHQTSKYFVIYKFEK